MIEQEYEISKGVYYIHKRDHRNNSPAKSQWIITETEERSCFGHAYHSKWIPAGCSFNYWGLHFDNLNHVTYLGVSKKQGPEQYYIFIAKFIDSNRTNKWHGYPANHIKSNQDIPPQDILFRWANAGYISMAQVRKLMGGKKCKL